MTEYIFIVKTSTTLNFNCVMQSRNNNNENWCYCRFHRRENVFWIFLILILNNMKWGRKLHFGKCVYTFIRYFRLCTGSTARHIKLYNFSSSSQFLYVLFCSDVLDLYFSNTFIWLISGEKSNSLICSADETVYNPKN